MAQKSKGLRRKTRKKLTKDDGRSGTIAAHLHEYDEGEQVLIDVDPSVQDGMPHPRFHGRTAVVAGVRGRSFVITLEDGGKTKEFTVHPAHLREL
jgi:large subunit ribosomal protein L21e